MTVAPIGGAAAAVTQSLPVQPKLPSLPTGEASGVGGAGFGDKLAAAVDGLQGAQMKADRLAVDAAMGNLTNVHDYMIAATEASLATELTVAVRNKAVDAFNQIMAMGV